MTKREFIMQFVLNRATADRQTDAPFWVDQANKAWTEIEKVAPGVFSAPPNMDSAAVTPKAW